MHLYFTYLKENGITVNLLLISVKKAVRICVYTNELKVGMAQKVKMK